MKRALQFSLITLFFCSFLSAAFCNSPNNCSEAIMMTLPVSASSTNSICTANNGTVTASASVTGGTGAVTYAWDNGGSGATLTNLAPGTYVVTATGANGATGMTSVVVGQTNTVLTVSATATNATCTAANGTATASASGGTATYSYAWSNSASGATAIQLVTGAYNVTATDVNGCMGNTSVNVGQTNITLGVAASSTAATCTAADGTAIASASGGTAAYNYLWSNSNMGSMITGIAAATYTVVATDANGCTGTTSTTVGQNNINLNVAATSTPSSGADGTATASASGGTAAYNYAWDNGGSGATITGLSAGNYSVVSTDINGCTGTANVEVSTLLPVELVDFTGVSKNEIVYLNWLTATEINNSGFFIERSEDAKEWENIGFVTGNQNTHERQEYQFLDKNPLSGRAYYRLKQVDFDGHFDYSPIISIYNKSAAFNLNIFPNPSAGNVINLNLFQDDKDVETVGLKVFDFSGKMLLNQNYEIIAGLNEIKLDLQELINGVYLMQIVSKEKIGFERFVIEK